MFVTAIQPQARRKSRVDIYLDGVVAGDVSLRIAKDRSLRPGLQLTVEQFEAIVAEDRQRLALDTAVAMLARRPHSEREIRRRLRQRRLDEDVMEETVVRLRIARLLDDEEYARSFAESRGRTSPRSRRLLVQELRAAGVDVAIASAAVEDLSDSDSAYRLAQARMRTLSRLDREKFRARLSGLLQRRGFGWDVTRATIEQCWQEVTAGAETEMVEAVKLRSAKAGRMLAEDSSDTLTA